MDPKDADAPDEKDDEASSISVEGVLTGKDNVLAEGVVA